MKNFRSLFTTLALALFATAAFAQVKVGDNPTTIDASSVLEVESTTGGFLLPRMTEAQRDAIVSPATGLMIYNLTLSCPQVNDGTPAAPEWNCISGIDASTNGRGIVSSYGTPGCTAGSISGTMTEGVAVSGVTMTIYANVTQVGSYNITAGPVNGVTFSGSGTFAATGCQEIMLTATGTPTAAGSYDYSLNTTPSETVTATVAAAFDPSAITPGVGSLSGKTCFDIALSNNNTNGCAPLTSRTLTQADFTNPATHTQTYTFTPSGTVSNVRFYYINDVGDAVIAISGGDAGDNISTAVTATVNYNTNNNTLALGLTNSNAMTTRIFAVYNINATNNNNPADDRVLALTANVKDCLCGCGVKVSPTEYKQFLCHNLGAHTDVDPHDMAQADAWKLNGAYVQWGRRGPNITGDSRADWVTAGNTSNFAAAPTGSTAATANSGVISGWSATAAPDYAWRTAGGAKTADDPCPAGWRVPTRAEWIAVHSNNYVSRTTPWGGTSSTQYRNALHYGSVSTPKLLTLPAAGSRNFDGSITNRGFIGFYWMSTESLTNAGRLFFTNTDVSPLMSSNRLNGMSIRCIAE
ncbi:FISUMP domain-containing protein [Phaeodactylibacter luteus]|uniref:Fibrobacter succinogenes major paralogous domain-containing protein n=1 Tax=Phaeodactylibacter luteus TaxID=1564516 RepID=A0A5C6RL94_9BACT|nr:FISUMP domain-containing protein [Phaeodactylibacter luteus]TXB62724.1 hypothetical protein FRY97_12815 [Phaeodactylibacter luteus]